MWYLYLDESGDLGFDFVNKKPSKFFTITILVIKGDYMSILSKISRESITSLQGMCWIRFRLKRQR